MDAAQLRAAYDALLTAADTVLGPDGTSPVPPAGEWDAIQILAHIAAVDAGVLAAAHSIAAGAAASYDNRAALEVGTLSRVAAIAGDSAGLRRRVRRQGDALCVLAGDVLTDAELDTPLPTLLASAGVVQLDQAIPLRALIGGLAGDHLPRHTDQLLALQPQHALSHAVS